MREMKRVVGTPCLNQSRHECLSVLRKACPAGAPYAIHPYGVWIFARHQVNRIRIVMSDAHYQNEITMSSGASVSESPPARIIHEGS